MIISIFISSPSDIPLEETPKIETINLENYTVPELISYISKNEYNLSDEVPLAIGKAESDYLNVCNRQYSCIAGIGPMQIVQSTFDEQCSGEIHNVINNVRCGIKMIANEEYWRWQQSMDKWLPTLSEETRNKILSSCSCVKGLRSFGIPIRANKNAKDLPTNGTMRIGNVALFNYNGVYHAALITGININGFSIKETNYVKCKYTEREIRYTDKSIRGFYDPY